GAKLPEYMVPAAYVRLEKLPLTTNGKLDRKALPAPDEEAYATQQYEAPQGEMEQKLAEIWAEVLKLERVGRHDNFFALGGHSLLAVRVMTRLRQMLGVEVGIRELFAHPVLAELVRSVEQAKQTELPPITRSERGEYVPMSFAQQRLWFLAQIEGVSRAYHIAISVELRGALDRAALRRALDRIVARHEILRTTFTLAEGEPVQEIGGMKECRFHLVEQDLRHAEDQRTKLQAFVEQEAGARFDLERGPLIRGRLICLAEDRHALLFTMHHVIFDGWSTGVFLDELNKLYRAYVKGEDAPLPEPAVQYADYTIWQRKWITGGILEEQGEYWQAMLEGAPTLLELPADRARPAQQDYVGGIVELALDARLTSGLKALGQRHGATLFMTLLAGWTALLARLSGQKDVVIGTSVANRGRAEIEKLIGFFVNTLALRVKLPEALLVGQLLELVKTQSLAAQQNQDVPFEQVVELARPERSLAHSPLFQVMFVWQNIARSHLDFPGIEARPLQAAPHVVIKFDLTLMLREAGDRIVGGVEYASALFEPATIERYLGYLRQLLESMVADENQQVQHLSLLSQSERQQVLFAWNDTAAAYPGEQCVHELFEAQARRTPRAVALVYEGSRLTYQELNCRANQLAHYLRTLGVTPDTRVAICAESSMEMVIGLLGILKSGGAYVPLDYTYPVQRLRYMLDDSAPAVLLIQGDVEDRFPAVRAGLQVVNLGREAQPWKDQPETGLERERTGLTSRHLAYVIYTSGSTGQPKGVMIEHRSVVNLACAQQELFGAGEQDRLLQFFSFSFDVSMFVMVMTLSAGATLVLARREELLPGPGLVRLMQEEGITMAVMPPVVLGHLPDAELPKLGQVVLGGEAWGEELVEKWGQGRRFFNSYGPTETTVQASVMEYRRGDGKPSIGRPIRNVHMYLLDTAGQPVPPGVAGELYIGGDGVGRGYLGSTLTAERFVPDPFSGKLGARLYRTGDWGRWLADGRIDLAGRKDDQIKIRGYRVELGEIEAVLGECPLVQQGVVVLAGEKQRGDQRLVAHLIMKDGQELRIGELRAYLKEELPEYMVPAQFMVLKAFPLTESGKVDRKALPAPDEEAYATQQYEAPQGEMERKLAEIWAEVLKLEKVGRHDNFFALGGHSLLAVRVMTRLRQAWGVEVGIREL
ncbi:MAG TPA: amino acid adenylation domain-containing protein, partial [Terriglobales bacterium]|nr:amino acid adenylation domain-containing protein [Terriglobales bacterium]